MSTQTTPEQRAAEAMESPAVFSKLKSDPKNSLGSFADAFQVPLAIFKGAFDDKVAADAEAEKAKGRNKRIAEKAKTFSGFISEVSGYDLPGSLLRIVEKGRAIAIELSDEDSTVTPSFFISFGDEGIKLGVSATGLASKRSSGGSGETRKTYDYFDGGNKIAVRLKPYILKTYPDSSAAGLIKDHDPKLGGTKKGAMSAFDAAMKDDVLKGLITRTEKVKDMTPA
jgi:hypothetical protein